jgi:hypothetical protein
MTKCTGAPANVFDIRLDFPEPLVVSKAPDETTFEVPEIYGNECRYYKTLELDLCEDIFIEYAESLGREVVVEEN